MCHPQLPSWLYHFLVSSFYGCCYCYCCKDVSKMSKWCWCILMHFVSDFIWLCWISWHLKSFWCCRGTNPSSASRSSPSSETSLSSQDSSPVFPLGEWSSILRNCWSSSSSFRRMLKTIMVSVGSYIMKWLGIRPWPYDPCVTTCDNNCSTVRRCPTVLGWRSASLLSG